MQADQELKEFVVNMYEAVSNGDSVFLENFLADQGNVLMIGTDSNEWWSKANTIIEITTSLVLTSSKVSFQTITAIWYTYVFKTVCLVPDCSM